MVILLQSVTYQIRRLFWHISYYKVRQSNFITKCDRLLLQSASGITKCDRLYYKVRQVSQSNTGMIIHKNNEPKSTRKKISDTICKEELNYLNMKINLRYLPNIFSELDQCVN